MKDIPGFEEKYAVTEDGNVWSYKHKKFLKPKLVNGYPMVDLFKAKDTRKYPMLIHRIVAMTYIPNPDNLPEVNHKDERKTNPRVDNLEWCTHKHNMNYGTRTERAEASKTKESWKWCREASAEAHRKSVRCIETGKIYRSIKEAANSIGMKTGCHISQCCNGTRNVCGGYHWQYEE